MQWPRQVSNRCRHGGSFRTMWRRRSPWLVACLLLVAALQTRPAQALETAARHALIVDFTTGAILLEKDADSAMPPASMSKMMTVYILFERLKDGRVKLDDSFPVSEKAWRMGGSRMFLKVNSSVKVEDLIRGIVIQSGNDACVVVAEALAGSEEAFAEEMTRRAREIGMRSSSFRNASGWPDPNHYVTARDLAHLARRIIEDFPEYYHYYSEKSFTYNDIRQGNRNPLLYKSIGADGLKTGHTEESGYGLTASAQQGDRRLILVINGLESKRQRAQESERLMLWGFREFQNYALFKAGETVAEAKVWLGTAETVPLRIKSNLTVTLPRKSRNGMKVSVQYQGPIPAPVHEGTVIAHLKVVADGTETMEIPLVAGTSVRQLGFFSRLFAAFQHLVWGAAG